MHFSETVKRVCVVALVPFLALSLIASPVLADDDDDDDNGTEVHKVDCNDDDETLQEAIDEARIGDTIKVKGICNENVVIMTDKLTVVADGFARIDGSGDPGALAAIAIRAQSVTIRGLEIIASRNGIIVQLGGSAIIETNHISGAINHGVIVTQGSYARVGGSGPAQENKISGNGLSGVTVRNGSAGDIFFNTITGDGIPASVVNNQTINDDRGIQTIANGAVDVADNTIDGFDAA